MCMLTVNGWVIKVCELSQIKLEALTEIRGSTVTLWIDVYIS